MTQIGLNAATSLVSITISRTSKVKMKKNSMKIRRKQRIEMNGGKIINISYIHNIINRYLYVEAENYNMTISHISQPSPN